MDPDDDLPPAVALGRAVATRRTAMGMKRKDLAKAAELSYPYISEIENGGKEPSARALRRIADALDLSIVELTSLRARFDDDTPDLGGAAPAESLSFAVAPRPEASVASGPDRDDLEAMVRRVVRDELDDWARTRLPDLVRRELDRLQDEGFDR